MKLAANRPLTLRIATNDTSMAPVNKTSISPIATMPTMADCCKMVEILRGVRKFSVASERKRHHKMKTTMNPFSPTKSVTRRRVQRERVGVSEVDGVITSQSWQRVLRDLGDRHSHILGSGAAGQQLDHGVHRHLTRQLR
jgi:hypothetical protein